jgi:hypothetical protein
MKRKFILVVGFAIALASAYAKGRVGLGFSSGW